ncbi:MAG TPA: PAS domain-containing protein [Syntrophales bacterium]|nr:PAS domain-containing protein [Syntrophales bacterium]
MENVIDGVVITFTEITRLKTQAEELTKMAATEAALSYAQAIVETVREPLVVLDGDLHVISANRAFYKFLSVAPGEVEGRFIYELGNGQWNIPPLRKLLGRILTHDEILENFQVELNVEKTRKSRALLNARRITHEGIPRPLILLAIEIMN